MIVIELPDDIAAALKTKAATQNLPLVEWLKQQVTDTMAGPAGARSSSNRPTLALGNLGSWPGHDNLAEERPAAWPLDWSQCPAVESVPGKRSGAWVFRDTRTPVSVVFENLEAGATVNEIMDWFHLSQEQIITVLAFAARSLDSPLPAVPASAATPDAHPVR